MAGQPRSEICCRPEVTEANSARLLGAPDIEDIQHGALRHSVARTPGDRLQPRAVPGVAKAVVSFKDKTAIVTYNDATRT
jgi:hypothetical protein